MTMDSLKYKVLLDSSDDFIIFTDESGDIEEYSKKVLILTEEKKLLGKSIFIVLPELKKYFSKFVSDSNVNEFINVDLFDDNRLITYLKISELKENTDIKYIYIIRDTGVKSRLENQKRQFIHLVEHELNTPLNGIIGFLSLLEDELKEHKMNEFLEMFPHVINSSKNLSGIVDKIIYTSDILSQKRVVDKEELNVNEILNGILKKYGKEIIEKNIEVIKKYDYSLKIIGDIKLFEVALSNIVENAIKFNKYKGKIKIIIVESGDMVSVSIDSSGKGIDNLEIVDFGEPFYQGSGYSTRENEGIGIGLFLTKKIVNIFGGKFEMINGELDGIKIIMRFPFAYDYFDGDERLKEIKKECDRKVKLLEKQLKMYADDLKSLMKK